MEQMEILISQIVKLIVDIMSLKDSEYQPNNHFGNDIESDY